MRARKTGGEGLIVGEWAVAEKTTAADLILVEVAPGVRQKMTRTQAARLGLADAGEKKDAPDGATTSGEKKLTPAANKARRGAENKAG